jgi:hypothetical protein
MGIIADMYIIVLVCLLNIFGAVFLGTYWLKHEKYPWEKSENLDSIK